MIRFKAVLALLDSLSLGVELRKRPPTKPRRRSPVSHPSQRPDQRRALRAKIDQIEREMSADFWKTKCGLNSERFK